MHIITHGSKSSVIIDIAFILGRRDVRGVLSYVIYCGMKIHYGFPRAAFEIHITINTDSKHPHNLLHTKILKPNSKLF